MRTQILHLFRSLLNHFPRLNAYAKRRRFTIPSLLLSIICMVLLTMSIRGYFKIDTSYMEVGIFSSTETVRLYKGEVNLQKGDEADELTIMLSFSTKNPSATGSLTIKVPIQFKLSDSIGLKGFKFVETWARDSQRYYAYSTTNEDSPYVFLKFNGSAFTSNAREVDFTLFLKPTAYDNPPIVVTITGLDRSDISYITPEPSFRSSYAIQYNPLRWNSASPVLEPIKFQIRDREKGFRTDFSLFITGVILGVFASLFASILWDIVREHEIRNSSKT